MIQTFPSKFHRLPIKTQYNWRLRKVTKPNGEPSRPCRIVLLPNRDVFPGLDRLVRSFFSSRRPLGSIVHDHPLVPLAKYLVFRRRHTIETRAVSARANLRHGFGKLFILFGLQLLFLILKQWKKISEKKKKESISIIYYVVSFFYIFLFFFFFSYVDSGNIFPSIIFLMLRNFMKSKSLKLVSCSWNYFV